MGLRLFTHGNSTAVIQGTDCAFFGLVVFVADDVREICEEHVLVHGSLFAHFVAVLVPEVTDDDDLGLWCALVDVCDEHLKVFLEVRGIRHVLAQLYGYEIELVAQEDVQEVQCLAAVLHALPRSVVDAIGGDIAMLDAEFLLDSAEVIAIRLCRADAAPPACDQRQAVADGQIVIGVIAVFRLDVVVIRDLLQALLQIIGTPFQRLKLPQLRILALFMPIDLVPPPGDTRARLMLLYHRIVCLLFSFFTPLFGT